MEAAYVFSVRFRLDPGMGVSVSPAAFETDRAHYDALRTAIGDDLAALNADGVDEVVSTSLAGSVDVDE